MSDDKIDARLLQKSRLCWLLGIIGALFIGVTYYMWFPAMELSVYLVLFAVFVSVYSVVCQLITKTTVTFFWKSLLFPFGLLLAYFLNSISPKPWFSLSSNLYPFSGLELFIVGFLLLAIGYVFSFFSIGITKFVSGHEALITELPSKSYSFEGNCDETFAVLNDFLKSLVIQPDILFKDSNRIIKFYLGSNEYYVLIKQTSEKFAQIDFVPLSQKVDTIIHPNKQDFDNLTLYFDAFLENERLVKTINWDKKNYDQKTAKLSQEMVLKRFTSPIRFSELFATRGLTTQKTITYLKVHKTGILTFIISAIVIQIIIKYL